MYRPTLRGRSALADKKVLLIDSCQATRKARVAVLRSRRVTVYEAGQLSTARFLWHPNEYDLVMLDVRRYSPEEALEFYEQIKGASPKQRIVFLTGSPKYLSSTWPDDVTAGDASHGQWAGMVKRYLAAA